MMTKVFFCIILITFIFHYGDTIKCLVCNSQDDSNCAAPDGTNMIPVDCEKQKPGADMCATRTNTTDGKTVVHRECSNIKDEMEGASVETCIMFEDNKICHCIGDGCNKD